MANTLEIIVKAKDQASGTLNGIGKTLGGLGDIGVKAVGVVSAAAAGVVTAVAAAAATGLKLAVDAIPAAGVMGAFEGVADDAAGMLQALRDASSGMATDVQLMQNYNLAAMLVGETFADQLPDAMQYLAKVSAATGTTMEYQMDSLVRGVGRLSPLILDNLGVSLKLEDAYATYAATIGKTVDELSKEEQQAAVMAEVMRQLADNTADMPDISPQAKAWAGLNTMFQNLKTNIGLALGPSLVRMVEPLAKLLERLAPYAENIAAWFGKIIDNNVAPIIERIAEAIGLLFKGQQFGALKELFGPQMAVTILEIADAIGAFVSKIATFVSEHKDAFIGAIEGIAAVLAGGMVYNAIMAIVAAIGAISWPILAVIAAVTLLALAWANNWGGIQEKTAAVMDWLRGAIGTVTEWMRGIWAQHGEEVSAHWSAMWAKISETASAVAEVVKAVVGAALEAIRAWWSQHGEQVMVIVRLLWDTIKTAFETAFTAIREFGMMVMDMIAGDWQSAGEHWQNIITTIWEGIKTIFTNQITALWEIIKLMVATIVDIVKGIDWKGLGRSIINGIKDGVVSRAKALAQAVAEAAKNALNAAKGALGISSPSKVAAAQIGVPFVQGISKGIDKAMAGMARMQMPQMATQMVSASQRGMATAGNRTINQTYNLIVNTNAATEPIIADFAMMRAMAG